MVRHLARLAILPVVFFLLSNGSAMADLHPGVEPIDAVATDSTMASTEDSILNAASPPSAFTSKPVTFPFDALDYSTSASVRAGIFRAQMAGRFMPTLTSLGKWFTTYKNTTPVCGGPIALAACVYGAWYVGYSIGGAINKKFLLGWDGGHVCDAPWDFTCTANTGTPFTPNGVTDVQSSNWQNAAGGSTSFTCSGWGGSGSPCVGFLGQNSTTSLVNCSNYGCSAANLTLSYACSHSNFCAGNPDTETSHTYTDTDDCTQFVTGGSSSYLGGGKWKCNYTSTAAINDSIYAWGNMLALNQAGKCIMYLVYSGNSTIPEPPGYVCYMTPAMHAADIKDVVPTTTIDGVPQPEASPSYTPPTPTTTDRANVATQLKNPDQGNARRAMDCYLDPTSAFCTDATKTAGNTTPTTSTGTTNVIVTNFPGTQTVNGSVTTFTPFTLPEPDPNETYSDYLDRLRVLGWVGTANVIAVEPTDVPGFGPNAITGVAVNLGTEVSPIPSRGGWPLNPPEVPDAGANIHIRINTPTAPAPSLGSNCGPTPPAADLTPITGIPFGSKFPFGIFSFVAAALAPLVASPLTPVFDIPIDLPLLSGPDATGTIHVDLTPLNPYMSMIRLLMSIGIALSAIYMLASSLLGFRAGNAGGGLDLHTDLGDE